jgi:parallel beta-helix repeat protein
MKPIVLLSVVGALACGTASAPASTNVGGPILTNTTWGIAGSPYIVVQSIIVGNGATLTIEPGVEVRFDAGRGLTVGYASFPPSGTLVARGTAVLPILFTSNTTQQPGAWVWIYFTTYAVDGVFQGGVYQSGCALENVEISYAGSGDVPAVKVEGSSAWLASCNIHDNLNRGIWVDGNNAPPTRIEDCRVSNNRGGGIEIQGGGGHILSGNYVDGNTTYGNGGGMHISGGGSNTVSWNTVTGNSAGSGDGGGGMFFEYSEGNMITANTVTGNTAYEGGGMDFWFDNGDTISGNTISGNTAALTAMLLDQGERFRQHIPPLAWGGGMYLLGGSDNTISGNRVVGNTASDWGGGLMIDGATNDTTAENTISGNMAAVEGAGVYVRYCDDVAFHRCVIVGNLNGGGATTGGVYVTGDSQGVSLAGDPNDGAYNSVCANDGWQIRNDNTFRPDGLNDIDARHVNWWTCDTQQIQDGISDYFDDASRAMVLWYPFVESAGAGDLNCDCVIDFGDINPFVLYLSNFAGWQAAFPACDALNGDINGDGIYGQASFGDINPFVALLTGRGAD